MTRSAAVAVFMFRRPEHLRRTLQSLQRCRGFSNTPIVIFGDGPRNANDREAVDRARTVARELLGDDAEYHFREINAGLSKSIIDGVDDVLSMRDRVIVLEDDLEVAPSFLEYMNLALDTYDHSESIFQVSGHMFDVPEFQSRADAIFLPFTTSWGWATWRRAWRGLDAGAKDWQLLQTDPALRRRFNLGNAYDYASMLEGQMAGRRDSWAIRWYWSVFRAEGLVLFPPRALVRNLGLDGSGTHGRGSLRRFKADTALLDDLVPRMPRETRVTPEDFLAVRHSLRRINGGRIGQIVDRLRRAWVDWSPK